MQSEQQWTSLGSANVKLLCQTVSASARAVFAGLLTCSEDYFIYCRNSGREIAAQIWAQAEL